MSLYESMQDVGRPVSYYPKLSRFFKSVNASLFYSQLFYWLERTNNPLGVYKTAEEWEEETGLSYREQATARKILRDRGFLVETEKKLEHRIYFQLDHDLVNTDFDMWKKEQKSSEIPGLRNRRSGNAESADREVRKAQSVNSTEITAETTTETIGMFDQEDTVNHLTSEAALFDKFWKAYPKKVAKDAAIKAFNKRKPDEQLTKKMIDMVNHYKTTEGWTKDGGKFIPYPASWLNGGCFDDELEFTDKPEVTAVGMFV